MGTELVGKTNLEQIQELVAQSQQRIAALLPAHIRVDRMISVTLELIAGDTKLRLCTPESILTAVLEASQLGLLLMKNLGHGYLVPYKSGYLSKQAKRDILEAKFIIGYRGFINMVERSEKQASSVFSRIVYPGEQFQIIEGTRHELSHTPSLDGLAAYKKAKKGKAKEGEAEPEERVPLYRGAYAVVLYTPSAPGIVRPADFEWMATVEIERIRAVSRATSEESPWNTWPEEMIKKTPIRRLCKRLNLSPDLVAATVRDEYRELGYEDVQAAAYQIREPQRKAPALPEQPAPEEKAETSQTETTRAAQAGASEVLRIRGEELGPVLAALRESGKTSQQFGEFLMERYKTEVLSDVPLTEKKAILDWIAKPEEKVNNSKSAGAKSPPQKPGTIGKQKGAQLQDLAFKTGWNPLEWAGYLAKTWNVQDVADLPESAFEEARKAAAGESRD